MIPKQRIIAHRGFWKDCEEKNTEIAFRRAFEAGFGVETDFRDVLGRIVISHNMPNGTELEAEAFFSMYHEYKIDSCLALNIKADGIQMEIKRLLAKYNINNYFVFDMSIPDTIGYKDNDINFFSRRSEYEPFLPFYKKSSGIWYDFFETDYYDDKEINEYFEHGKSVCFVSSELHSRKNNFLWERMINISSNQVLICTDYPEMALHYFGGGE
jgi:hypothetical protein